MPKTRPKISRTNYRIAKNETNCALSIILSRPKVTIQDSEQDSARNCESSSSQSLSHSSKANFLSTSVIHPCPSQSASNSATVSGECNSDSDSFHYSSDSESDFLLDHAAQLNTAAPEATSFQSHNFQVPDVSLSQSDALAKWAIDNRITHTAINQLLKILKSTNCNPNLLPGDARTLLNTPRSISTKHVPPGYCYHFGLKKCILNILAQLPSVSAINTIELFINIDGLPLAKSSQSQVYPILCCLVDNQSCVDIIGIYHGFEKPKLPNIFLEDFVNEVIQIDTDKIEFENKIYPIKIKGFICDVPAKSFITHTKGHSGYYSCSKCDIEGTFSNGRVCFPGINFNLRTDEGFRLKVQGEHHTGTSVLEQIPNIDMISDFVLDPMHLLYLGVVKKLVVSLWLNGKPPTKLSANQVQKVSEKLVKLKDFIPCEFNRKPRSLLESKRWKATEFRQFVFYTGPVVLKSTLNADMYLNFLSLHVSLTVLSNSKFHDNFLTYANSLLTYFVQTFMILYGKENISHNIHNLQHLCSDSKRFGLLENYSAFSFENYMQQILKFIRKNEKPLEQIVFRKTEIDSLNMEKSNNKAYHPTFCKEYFGGCTLNLSDTKQFENLKFDNFVLKIFKPDNCCSLKDGSILLIHNFVTASEGFYIIGVKFNTLNNFYDKPSPSSQFSIYSVRDNDVGPFEKWSINSIEHKCIKLPYNEDCSVIFPLLHCDN